MTSNFILFSCFTKIQFFFLHVFNSCFFHALPCSFMLVFFTVCCCCVFDRCGHFPRQDRVGLHRPHPTHPTNQGRAGPWHSGVDCVFGTWQCTKHPTTHLPLTPAFSCRSFDFFSFSLVVLDMKITQTHKHTNTHI